MKIYANIDIDGIRDKISQDPRFEVLGISVYDDKIEFLVRLQNRRNTAGFRLIREIAKRMGARDGYLKADDYENLTYRFVFTKRYTERDV